MMTLPIFASFLGWSLLLNIVILSVSTIAIAAFRAKVSKIHAKLFRMEAGALGQEYFRYLAHYKLLVIVFNLTPWPALKLMAE
ncbi:hypothetical protein N9B21_02155 [Verrucomicrobiales bacterium]|jgi:hypothetical protein|nr:hypothetical protein [Verrucomicrobiales bacterium]MDA7926819.1 hypothetical protein [Verrucomicrobiales bacterium]